MTPTIVTLADVAQDIATILLTVTGIANAPAEPPESLPVFPFAVVFVGMGTWEPKPIGQMTGTFDATLEVHVARTNLPQDVRSADAYSTRVPAALFLAVDKHRANHFQYISVCPTIDFKQGEIGYGRGRDGKPVPTYGFIFTLKAVQVRLDFNTFS